jgi:hypothetical protein
MTMQPNQHPFFFDDKPTVKKPRKARKPKDRVLGVNTHDNQIKQLNQSAITSQSETAGGLPIENVLWNSHVKKD